MVFETLLQNQLYAKKSKCSFNKAQLEYLGHLISEQGVEIDLAKIECMKQWPIPNSLKSLRGFFWYSSTTIEDLLKIMGRLVNH